VGVEADLLKLDGLGNGVRLRPPLMRLPTTHTTTPGAVTRWSSSAICSKGNAYPLQSRNPS